MYWHHICVDYNKEGEKQVYIDGTEITSLGIYKSHIPVKFKEEVMDKTTHPCTFDFFVWVGLSIKNWTYAQKWSLAHHIKRM